MYTNKVAIFTILLLTSSLGLELQVVSQLHLDQSYSLVCSGAQGQVTYQAYNLPQGVKLNNDKIQISDNNLATGYYPIKIRAQDSANAVDERLIVLIIKGGNTVSINTGSLFENQQTVKNVRISSTNSINIRSSALTDVNTASTSNTLVNPNPFQQLQPDTGINTLLDSLKLQTLYHEGTTKSSYSSSTTTNNVYFPNINFPTGGSANAAPNFTPTLISMQQARPIDANRNQITVDDIKKKAIFQRQLNSAKALANLLSIVREATAKKNAAQEETVKRQQIYNQAISRQKQTQATIIKAENDVARIRQAITQLTEHINRTQKSLNDLDALDKDKKAQKESVRQGAFVAQTQLNNVLALINANKNYLESAYDSQKSKQTQCNNLDNEINNWKNDRDNKAGQAASISFIQASAKAQLDKDTRRVQQLQKQLAAAQAKAAASEKAYYDLVGQQNSLKNSIDDITNRIKDLQDKKGKCVLELNDIGSRIIALRAQTNELNEKKGKVQSQFKALAEKIAGLTAQINSNPAQIADLNAQLAQANKNMNFLRNQLPIFSRILNDAYVAGNTVNDLTRAAKQSLDAVRKRFTEDQKIIQTATYNIQLARTEKDQANQAVQALLRDGAGVLPYAAAFPSATNTGFTVDPTTGNYQIKSWPDFILNSYGIGIKPLFVGDFKNLYSFRLPKGSAAQSDSRATGTSNTTSVTNNTKTGNTTTGNATTSGSATRQNDQCNSTRNLKAVSGFIARVNPDSYRIISDGGAIQVTFTDCAIGLSNKLNYVPSVGDVIAIKGFANNTNSFRATQVACVSQ